MKPEELIQYLQNQDPATKLPMSPEMATGQLPGVPGLPGMSEDSGHSQIHSPYPPLSESGPNEEEELFSDGGVVGSSDTAKDSGESPIIIKLREMLMGKKGDLTSDQRNVQAANQVDQYSNGGMVDKVKEHISKMYDKAQKGPMLEDSTLQGFQNMVSSPTAKAPGYARGGMIDDPLMTPPPASFAQALQPASIPQPSTGFDPHIGLPPAPPSMPVQQAPAPISPRPDIMPLSPQRDNQYFQQQHNQVNSYGPEQQRLLQAALQKQRTGLGGKLPVALGSLADSLMQGVARAGNPGFADRIQGQQNELAKEQMGALEGAGKLSKENLEANAQIDAMDPRSPLSKVAQDSYGPLLIKNGFKPQQVQGMSAKNIADLTGKTVEALKAESEAKMAAATLGLKTQEAENTVRHQKVEEGLGQSHEVMKAGEELRAHPIQRMLGILPGQKGLEQTVDSGTDTSFSPDVLDYAKTHGISPQQAAAIKQARTGGQI